MPCIGFDNSPLREHNSRELHVVCSMNANGGGPMRSGIFVAIVAIILFGLFAMASNLIPIRESIAPRGEYGPRQVAAVYPSAIRGGRWVLFIASDNTRKEALVRCDHVVKPGDSIYVDSQQYRAIESYNARCFDNPLPRK